MELEDLKTKEIALVAELRKLRHEKEKLETKIELPELKKKYEGKYFKYRNSYGSDSEGWWLYSYCVKIIGIDTCIVNCFESMKYGENCFKVNERRSLLLFNIQITPAEYKRRLKNFINAAKQL